ncbi:MAG: tRNA (N6-isopentenyl adenosine(37)-C2)-methylthiotransferase MiaB [Oscillospiraceae bacterium]|nr:tRNA (N6-isopentenyl adenosine(37)-C2)-methylthiotransferase MiaB [Oscillospiraceae bacterium]
MRAIKLAFTRTFGCRANVSDGEKINGMLAEMGYGFTREPDSAELIIFNTCAIRENAETKVFGNIGALIHQKRRNPDLIIAVCGCMVQQEHIAEKLYKTFPFVDLIFGTHVLHKLPELLEKVINERKRVVDISETVSGSKREGLPVRRESDFKADVPIMYGCDNFCSYCVVPYVRGREHSRNPEIILKEIGGLAESGVKEIMLLGQNVNSYGKGLPKHMTFAELLRQIDELESGENAFRVAYMTSHPKDLSRELLDVIADSRRISHHLHLPVQSGSDRILKLMNRGYSVKQYTEIIDYARERIPDISVTTDIIVGFPGETREDFNQTLDLIREARFDSAYTFIYSKREGTKASEMPDDVSSGEKSERFNEMLEVLDRVSGSAYERYIGKTLNVLCDGEGRAGGDYSGRSREGVIVDFVIQEPQGGLKAEQESSCTKTDIIGNFVNIKINDALKWALKGEIVEK